MFIREELGMGVLLEGGRCKLEEDYEGPESVMEQEACLGRWGLNS